MAPLVLPLVLLLVLLVPILLLLLLLPVLLWAPFCWPAALPCGRRQRRALGWRAHR
jgi:hypothetical protein